LVFVAALTLGAVTVVGQGDESENELRGEIARLTRMLQRHNARREPPAMQRVEVRSYDVADLCSPVLDARLAPHDLYESGREREEPEELEPLACYGVDVIIEILRETVAPESWDVVEGADIAPKGDRLFVTTLPAVHALIPPLLKRLRTLIDAQVVVEVVAVRVPPEISARLAARPRELSKEEAEALRAHAPLGAARLVCFDGQQVVQSNGRRRAYVADYDVLVADGASAGAPRRAELFEGCAVQVRACLDRTGEGAVLHCVLERTAVADVRQRETNHGTIELPDLELTRLQSSFWAPLGRTVVAGGADACVFLVTARRVGSG
jgi:hypothetical protein